MRFVSFGFVVLLSALTARLHAASYYVDYESGRDDNPGSSVSSAWQHCPGDPAAGAVAAASELLPGDTVYFKGGVTYVFTGVGGIMLNWDGAADRPITYDGNSSGAWGVGRAKFTDRHSGNAITAFFAPNARHDLAFKSLEIGPMGGEPALPADSGVPVVARFGGGIAFDYGVTGASIENCAFRELGYWFNAKPMTAAAIAGKGISIAGVCRALTITHCSFSRLAQGCDLTSAAGLEQVKLRDCVFGDTVIWSIDLPADTSSNEVSLYGCIEGGSGEFDTGVWTGYGNGPRVALKIAPVGSRISLLATAAASPAPTFQWFKNGLPIPDAVQARFSISAATIADAGIYTAVAANAGGSAVSNSMVVAVTSTGGTFAPPASNTPSNTVGSPPVITVHPTNQTVATLGTVTFTMAAISSSETTYQWTRNGDPIAGWTDATLVISSVTSNDAGAYAVIASNSAGSAISQSATLTVIDAASSDVAPVFSTHPVSQTATAFSTVTLSASASGQPAPSYQWRKNGVAIPGWTNATLVLLGVSSNDTASYSVVATNSAGSAVSAEAALVVIDPAPVGFAPVFTTQPGSQLAAGLTTVTFNVSAAGVPAPTYQWIKNGVVMAGWTNATLLLPGVTPNDNGTYVAVATNSAGATSSQSATLTVLEAAPTQVAKVLVSTQLLAGTSPAIVMFTVDGGPPRTVLLRALGPGLSTIGIGGVLPDPQLELNQDVTRLSANDNWGGGDALREAFNQAGALPISDGNSKDSALLVTLASGVYNAVISSADGSTGIVLIEIYQLP